MPQESAESEVRVRARERSHLDARSCHRADTPPARRPHRRSGVARTHGCGDPRGIRLARRDRVEDLRPRAAGHLEVRPRLRHAPGMGRDSQQVRSPRSDLGNCTDVLPGAPDRRSRLARDRALHERPERARGGSARPRGDSLGNGSRGRAPLHPLGRERRADPRPRPGGRRGDRSDHGARRGVGDPLVALPDGRHVGRQDRGSVPGRCEQHPARLARVPRRDSACHLVAREHRGAGDRPPLLAPADRGKLMAADAGRYTLTLSRRTKRRKVVNLLMQGIATVAALSAVAVLALVIASVAERGAGALSWDFFTKTAATFGESGGGVANALVGSLVLVSLATAMALPVGVLIAIYVSEFAKPRVADAAKLVLDVLNGLPSIIIGVFVYGLLVVGSGQAAWKGSFALAIIMLPLVARSTQEVLALVPASLREGALA